MKIQSVANVDRLVCMNCKLVLHNVPSATTGHLKVVLACGGNCKLVLHNVPSATVGYLTVVPVCP